MASGAYSGYATSVQFYFINQKPITMVTVTETLERVKKDATTFPVLKISSGVKLVLSKSTN